MKLKQIFTGKEVTLIELLDARSSRADTQKALLDSCSREACLISFSLNIPGPVKQFPLAEAAFQAGYAEIKKNLEPGQILQEKSQFLPTGSQAFFLLDADPGTIKARMTSIEESHPLGRLFDIDVLGSDGRSLSRSDFGFPPRSCIICGDNAKVCARGQVHSMELVLWRTAQILNDYFRGQAADLAASCMVRALLYEVSATPKPGLVDRNNSGSHQDMDFFTFLDSSAALIPWFREFFSIGWDFHDESDEQLFGRLRFAGKQAEDRMFSATGGVNTHKGLIFAAAIICGALGKEKAVSAEFQNTPDTPVPLSALAEACGRLGTCSILDFKEISVGSSNVAPGNRSSDASGIFPDSTSSAASDLSPGSTSSDASDLSPSSTSNAFSNRSHGTVGQRLYAAHGITGARGEAAAGFPTVLRCALPALKGYLTSGCSLNDAAALTLLALIAETDDTNMIHRGGLEAARKRKKEASQLLSSITPGQCALQLSALDASYIQANLSPGGCADLLAVSLMFYFLEQNGLITGTGSPAWPEG